MKNQVKKKSRKTRKIENSIKNSKKYKKEPKELPNKEYKTQWEKAIGRPQVSEHLWKTQFLPILCLPGLIPLRQHVPRGPAGLPA